jgi:hypothetical protein
MVRSPRCERRRQLSSSRQCPGNCHTRERDELLPIKYWYKLEQLEFSFYFFSFYCPNFSVLSKIADTLKTFCIAGYYLSSSGVCQQCPVGTWSSADKTSCEPCPAGQYAYKHLSCQICPAGQYSLEKWDECKSCRVGEVSQQGSSSCAACLPGQYASQTDNICKSCNKHTYSPGLVNSCTRCPSGYYAGVGEKVCHTCSPGENIDYKLNVCIKCAPSFYSRNPAIKCQKCPAGQFSGEGATSCYSCPPRTPVNDAQTGCKPSSCPLGHYFNRPNAKCVPCAPGFYTIDQYTPCKPCPYQHYTPSNAVYKMPYGFCTKCDQVLTPDKTECVHCPPSFFRQVSSNATQGPSKCVKCPKQYYSGYPLDWDTECHYCEPQWKINDEQTDCDREYYTEDPSYSPTFSPTYSSGCNRGEMEVPKSPEYPGGCRRCVGGTYSPYPWIPCAKCPPGLWSANAYTACQKCPGTTVPSDLQNHCLQFPTPFPTPYPSGKCKPGQIVDGTSCSDCPPGTYSPDPSVQCQSCPLGTYAPGGASECKLCTGVINNNRSGCILCEASYYLFIMRYGAGGLEFNRECRKCPRSQYSARNDVCHDCQKGYTANAAQTGCEIIIPTFAPTTYPGFKCPPGQYFPATGAGQCTWCLPSFYQPIVHTPCIKCPPGKYSLYEETACHQCPLGLTVGPNQDKCVTDPMYI